MMLFSLHTSFLRRLSIILAVVALAPAGAQAADAAPSDASKPESGQIDANWDRTKKLLSTVWNEGKQELYVPGYTWHNPSNYTQQQRDGYTTYAAGIGYGRTWTSDANNDHSLFAMTFQDSHNDIQPVVGYNYQWMWGKPGELRAGVGLSAGISARYDGYCKYCPFPYVLPIASISVWRISLMGTYVPRVGSNGDVAFLWAKITLD
jgi:palmitoyl transferase